MFSVIIIEKIYQNIYIYVYKLYSLAKTLKFKLARAPKVKHFVNIYEFKIFCLCGIDIRKIQIFHIYIESTAYLSSAKVKK